MRKITTLVLLFLAGINYPAFADNGDVTVDIKTGNSTALALGNDTNASINIGGSPQFKHQGCTHIKIEHGDLKRIAIGHHANARIQLPANQNTCKEK